MILWRESTDSRIPQRGCEHIGWYIGYMVHLADKIGGFAMKKCTVTLIGGLATFVGLLFMSGSQFAPAYAQQQFAPGNGLVNESAHAIGRERWRDAANLAEKALLSGDLTLANIPPAYSNLCVALTGERKFSEALDACNKAVDLRPRQWSFYNNRANVYFYQGKFDQALAEYYKAMAFSSGGSVLMHNIGVALEYRKYRGQRPDSSTGVEKSS
jgi:tetratricopeptide (TPR) repeat protein